MIAVNPIPLSFVIDVIFVAEASLVDAIMKSVSPCGTSAFCVIVSDALVAVLVTVVAAEYGVPIATQ